MATMCESALQSGITEIGISDHYDLHPNEPFPDYLNLEAWWRDFNACKVAYAGRLTLRAGVEVGEPHRFAHQVTRLLRDYPWDFILGSLHWVGETCVFDQAFFQSNERSAYMAYFRELEMLVEGGEFDILAHFDVVKRYGFEQYGPFQPERYESIIRRILNKLARRGGALEINTATLRRSIQQPSPDDLILHWFFEEGGRYITLGSDAHEQHDIGFGLAAMMAMVRTSGFEGLARFKHREISLMAFDGHGI